MEMEPGECCRALAGAGRRAAAGEGADGAAWAASSWGLETGREGTVLWGQAEQVGSSWCMSAVPRLCSVSPRVTSGTARLNWKVVWEGNDQSVLLEEPWGRCRFCGSPCNAEFPGDRWELQSLFSCLPSGRVSGGSVKCTLRVAQVSLLLLAQKEMRPCAFVQSETSCAPYSVKTGLEQGWQESVPVSWGIGSLCSHGWKLSVDLKLCCLHWGSPD